MTHDPREAEAFNRRFMEPFCNKHECRPCKECGTATDFIHHQLQKARHDWLREEIVRLEGMKNIVGSQTEISSNESLVKMVKNVIELKGEMAYNQALQTIIDRYHSELDQPTRDDWNENMEHSHGLNELDQDNK